MKNISLVSAVAAATLSVPFLGSIAEAASVTVLTIDPLTETQTVSGNTVNTFSSSTSISSPLLGTINRTIALSVTDTAGQFADVSVPIGPGDSGLSISNGTNVKSTTTVTYNLTGPIDFTQGGADRFILGVQASDFGGNVTFTVNGVSSTVAYDPLIDVQTNFELLYSSFAGVDFTNVNTFSLTAPTPGGASGLHDVTFDFFSTGQEMPTNVPEPGTLLGLIAFGGAGLLARRRQK